MTMEPEKKPEGRSASGPEPGVSSTSIFVFQRDESLAGLITRNADLSNEDFLAKNGHPVLLTSMPTEVGLTVWAVVLPIKRKEPRGAIEETLSKSVRDIWQDSSPKSGRFIVGRAPECDIVLAPRSVSRRHAAFELRDEGWRLMDLRSANGTKLSGRPLAPKSPVALDSQVVKIEFGPDTTLWYVPPFRLLEYVRAMQQQVPDTGRHDIGPWAPSQLPVTPVAGTPTVARIDKEKIQRAEAETNPLLRHESRPDAVSTWHDDSTRESAPLPQSVSPISPPTHDPSGSMVMRQSPLLSKSGEIEPRLLAAIRAIAALDSLILTVTARLKADAHAMTLYSAESAARLVDVPDQMMRLGPLLKTVHVSLSVGDGTPVEVYSDA